MVSETPPNAKYYKHDNDLSIVAGLFEDWKEIMAAITQE